MKDWKTTLLGWLQFASAVIAVVVTWLKTGVWDSAQLAIVVQSLFLALGLTAAADSKKT